MKPAEYFTPAASDADVVEEIRRRAGQDRVVFVSGNFNLVHPGHLRLLNFAADCGDFVVVGVLPDAAGGALLPAELRLEGVRSIGVVDYAFIMHSLPEDFIAMLEPAVVVKGKEHETTFNPELAAVEAYDGKLLFSSGEIRFSSLDLLQRELLETNFSSIMKPADFPQRHGFDFNDLVGLVRRLSELRVVVIGDLIVDEYINCEALGMSQEDPTIVVTPIKRDLFIGGAGIVAAHARGLGAKVSYFGVTGQDETAQFAADTLRGYGVDHQFLTDDSRPTTLKQRYRANGKTLLRVSHLRQHAISNDQADELFERIAGDVEQANLVIFSDFTYGCLPQLLVDRICAVANRHDVMMVADSQSSSQVGDVSRFKGMRLLTPTEHEARLSVRDFSAGLVGLAEALRLKAAAERVLVTLGAEGLLIHAPDKTGCFRTDRLPAFNGAPKDVSGAGDSLLTCASMALAIEGDIWRSAYLGSVAAACQVGRVGNTPLTSEELIAELRA
ncbi:MAG: adenylyltransferase/cytidyltransferase family protein [Gammaproteobacteria bacterium]|nr:adenylyltransferase/cytidyltransferase family protein [Gammaproteobacteria bacterium]MBI5615237.1 adenylyltransferase/cytidyltransferase family protein [Gammaproteobacteria bacterium]